MEIVPPREECISLISLEYIMNKRMLFVSIVAFLLAIPVAFSAYGEPQVVKLDKATYPYAPSLMKLEKPAGDFQTAETCGDCHHDKLIEWSGSVHSLAFKDPIYQGEFECSPKSGRKKNCQSLRGLPFRCCSV